MFTLGTGMGFLPEIAGSSTNDGGCLTMHSPKCFFTIPEMAQALSGIVNVYLGGMHGKSTMLADAPGSSLL